jgi:putative glutamine amidotransferase
MLVDRPAGSSERGGDVDPTDLPLIAVTTSSSPAAGTHGLPGVKLNLQYLAAVEAPGAVAVLLTPGHDDAALQRLVGMAHGLLLTGGEDVDPACYGQERRAECGECHPERDRMEQRVLGLARARGMPVLAICRGLQVVNVAMSW